MTIPRVRLALRMFCGGNTAQFEAMLCLVYPIEGATVRSIAAAHGVPEATLRDLRTRFARTLDAIAEAEGLTREELLFDPCQTT